MFFFFAPKSHSWGWVAQISPLVPYDIDLASVSLRKNSQQTQSPSLYGAGTHGFMPGKPPRNNRHFLNQFRAHISQTKNFSPRAISRLRSGNWHSHESKFTLGVGLPSSSRIRATRKEALFLRFCNFGSPAKINEKRLEIDDFTGASSSLPPFLYASFPVLLNLTSLSGVLWQTEA